MVAKSLDNPTSNLELRGGLLPKEKSHHLELDVVTQSKSFPDFVESNGLDTRGWAPRMLTTYVV